MNPIGCSDCHDSETMNLHISRPALREAFARQGKNIDEATPQEMRSLVCAQCHVEYYFRKSDNYLTFRGIKVLPPRKLKSITMRPNFMIISMR